MLVFLYKPSIAHQITLHTLIFSHLLIYKLDTVFVKYYDTIYLLLNKYAEYAYYI